MQFLFAWRYFKSKKSTNAINIIAWITVAAMAVGTAALIVVLSIFNGFEGLVKDLYASFYPDVRITARTGNRLLADSATLQRLERVPGIAAFSCVAETNAHLQYNNFRVNAVLKAVDDRYAQVTGVGQYMGRGTFEVGTAEAPALVLGMGIENALNLLSDRAIDPVIVYLPRRGAALSANPMEAISTFPFQPRGAFSIQQDFDNKYVLTHIDALRQLAGWEPHAVTAIEIKLLPGANEKTVREALTQMGGGNWLVENRYQQNRSLFAVMQTEKWAIYAILSLILIIAAFNMIGALTMLVLEKEQDIQILKALGATNGLIRRIFLAEGVLLAVAGSIIGTTVALLFCYLQVRLKLIPLQGSFVIDYYPVQVQVTDLLLVGTTVLFIALLASWVPAGKAAVRPIALKAQ